jgi:hypothetical protein
LTNDLGVEQIKRIENNYHQLTEHRLAFTDMTSNIEHLTEEDRADLLAVLRTCLVQTRIVHDRATRYEGRIATALDRVQLELGDACESLRRLLGERQLYLLLDSDNLNGIVKSSV